MIATATDLLKKYDVPGPRYTSYPTVLYWDRNPTADEWVGSLGAGLDEAKREGSGAAVYVHVPFCCSLCTYCGCNSRITQNASVGLPYVRTVLKEWELYRRLLGREKPFALSEMHFGGGTPTYLSPAELEELVGGILRHSERTPDAEFSIESDPRVTTPEHLQTLARLGFRRLSLGIQDFDREEIHILFSAHSLPLKIVERGDTYPEDVRRTVEAVTRDLRHPWSLCYQSRNGKMPWLQPYLEDELRRLAREGVRRVVVAPVSFVSDHIETLYELDRLYAGEARREGITHYYRARTFNDDPEFAAVLRAILKKESGV